MSVLGSWQQLDGPAVTVDGQSLTRPELFEAAAAVADQIHGAQVVAVDATASLQTIVAVVGCLLAGVAAVPVPPDSRAVRSAPGPERSAPPKSKAATSAGWRSAACSVVALVLSR